MNTTEFIAVWEEMVDAPNPFIRTHTRIVREWPGKPMNERQVWELVIRDNHLQEQNVLRATVKKLDDTFYGGW